MDQLNTTCWTVIESAAAGSSEQRDAFARRYGPIIRAYLAARWRHSTLQIEIEDAVQDTFVECFKENGLLQKADRERVGGFRAFLFGAVRNVAARVERKRGRSMQQPPPADSNFTDLAAHDETLSKVFDQAWAKSLLKESAEQLRRRAEAKGDQAVRRVELLRLRFEEGHPIREIAERWNCDAAELHREYAKARQEFKQALFDTVAFHCQRSPEEIEQQCAQLMNLIG